MSTKWIIIGIAGWYLYQQTKKAQTLKGEGPEYPKTTAEAIEDFTEAFATAHGY